MKKTEENSANHDRNQEKHFAHKGGTDGLVVEAELILGHPAFRVDRVRVVHRITTLKEKNSNQRKK